MEALQAEEERLENLVIKKDYKSSIFIHHSYKNRGLYYKQLKRYLNYFSMRNILVINSQTLFMKPNRTLRQIYQFIGVDTDTVVNDLKPHNIGVNKTKIDPGVYTYSSGFYRYHNQDLYGLVGQNFDWR